VLRFTRCNGAWNVGSAWVSEPAFGFACLAKGGPTSRCGETALDAAAAAPLESEPARPEAPLATNAESDGTPELPGDVTAAHHADHLATDLLVDDPPPRH
jgi:hypothetical protein